MGGFSDEKRTSDKIQIKKREILQPIFQAKTSLFTPLQWDRKKKKDNSTFQTERKISRKGKKRKINGQRD